SAGGGPGNDGAPPPPLLAREPPRATERAQAGFAQSQRDNAARDLPAPSSRGALRARPGAAVGGGRHQPGGVPRPVPGLRERRPVYGNASPTGPAVADPRPGGYGWESAAGRPPAGDLPGHAATETPRAGTPIHSPTGSRRRRPVLNLLHQPAPD